MSDFIAQILEGDPSAIKLFYTTYAPKLTKYFSNRLSAHEDIEAFVHDVFLEAIDSLPLFEKKSSLTTWLYKIAHNILVDFYRKKKVKSLLLSQIPFLQLVAHEVYEPEFQFEKNKFRDKIEITLRHLSHKYREILKLHYEEGKSIKEIAVLLDLSPKATESLLYRARMKFQDIYETE